MHLCPRLSSRRTSPCQTSYAVRCPKDTTRRLVLARASNLDTLSGDRGAALAGPVGGGPTPLGGEGPAEVEEGRSLWWVGLLVGIVAVGAGVGLFLALRPEAPEGSLGQVSLELR